MFKANYLKHNTFVGSQTITNHTTYTKPPFFSELAVGLVCRDDCHVVLTLICVICFCYHRWQEKHVNK